jgi:hypothetical protein
MATALTPVRVSQTGVNTPSVVPADLVEGNVVSNVEGVQLTVDNSAGASPVTVTFVTTATVAGYGVEDVTATVPTGGRYTFGRFDRSLFGDSVEFTCSAACDVSATR